MVSRIKSADGEYNPNLRLLRRLSLNKLSQLHRHGKSRDMKNKKLTPDARNKKSSPAGTHERLNPRHQAVLGGVVGVVFAGYLDDGREGRFVGVHLVPYPVGDLCSETLAIRGITNARYAPSLPPFPVCRVRRLSGGDESWKCVGWEIMARHTCWLIRMMPMSFLVCVYSSNASSIFRVSVLASTMRKFLLGSAPVVTC